LKVKILAISQRIEKIEEYSEIRDSLDQSWTRLISRLDFLPVPLPNLVSPFNFIETVKPSAIILSGGNTINNIDKADPSSSIQRDNFEEGILTIAIERGIPVVGVCRGMQMINLFFKGSTSKSKGHVGARHNVNFEGKYSEFNTRPVNSYHKWCISESDLGNSLMPFAIAEDKTIEGFYHKDHPIFGIMWHPEREEPYNNYDINLLKKFVQI